MQGKIFRCQEANEKTVQRTRDSRQLQRALQSQRARKFSNLKSKKSPGPDKVTNEMIQHLGHLGKTELSKICILSWAQGILPEEWKEAEIIPIHKQGKPKHDKASYRPISWIKELGRTKKSVLQTKSTSAFNATLYTKKKNV